MTAMQTPLHNYIVLCFLVFHYLLISIFTNPSAWTGYDTSSIFKRSLTGLNSDFPSSSAEEPNLPNYLPNSWRENNLIDTFPKGISAMWNAIILVQDLSSCRRVHFLRR